MLNVLKWLGLVVLVVTNTINVVLYRRVRKYWNSLPVVAATITRCSLDDYLTPDGGRRYEARIRFSYEFRGEMYESDTPALRGPQLFPFWQFESSMVGAIPSR